MFWKKEKDTVSVVSLGEEDVQRESIGNSTAKDKNQYTQDEVYSISSSTEKRTPDAGSEDQAVADPHQLKQGLKSRHVQLIALGGAIGTGLFVGTSSTLHTCGPAGLFISYCIISTVIYPIMQAIGEMVCYLPGTGNESAGSAAHLVNKYLDESLGFATAWNYYYCYVILVAAECTAASGVVEYWTERVPKAGWITIFLFMVVFLNFAAVKFYGESEFWFASIKILCIVGLIILSFILFWGGGPKHDRLGFRYWQHPGGFAHHIRGGSFGSFLDIYTGIIKGGFAFILGPELVAMTSAEVEDQRRNIAKASRRFVWRLMFFYILGALSISVIVAWNDPALTNALSQGKPGAGSSPFVIGIQNAGIHALPHIINACILTSAWSAGNAFMFASARSLLNMAHHGQAPRIFGRVNRWGVPYVAVAFSSAISCLAYLNCSSSTKDVFNWFSNISVISGFIGWICISVTYIRFHKAIVFRGMLARLPYKSWGMPYLIYWSLTVISIITLTNGYQVFIPRFWDAKDFVAAYITLPIFLVLWIGHRIYRRRIFTLKWWKSIEEIDVITGVEEIEEITRECDLKRVVPTKWYDKVMDAIL
ncbi:Proline-specific permease [Nakaseomyces bracarensis]|uniref:Proline-specific permease n=1 Tax=Nakaseomyces bracarensis TaxID=273131 RepID=A0ABR4NP45_9SACH